jgi:hypothetical protein
MRFSSMAVSVLAQSVPLLAVGHLAGWKKREERSWLQSRRLLRDALFVEDHDKKGVLFEKHGRVHGKQDNDVLEKKHSGSARLVQDSASSEVASGDREASVECDPLSKMSDSGIFGCGMDSHCVESEESKLGGLCVAANLAPSVNRALQAYKPCVQDEQGRLCDCSQFNSTINAGNATCTKSFCWETFCGNYTISGSWNADGSYSFEKCYDLKETAMGLESYCYSSTYDLTSMECKIKFNGVECISCEVDKVTCAADSSNGDGTVFDCTNTILKSEGNQCKADPVDYFVGANLAATSSGRSHTAKVPIVVSAAAAASAWMASFGA